MVILQHTTTHCNTRCGCVHMSLHTLFDKLSWRLTRFRNSGTNDTAHCFVVLLLHISFDTLFWHPTYFRNSGSVMLHMATPKIHYSDIFACFRNSGITDTDFAHSYVHRLLRILFDTLLWHPMYFRNSGSSDAANGYSESFCWCSVLQCVVVCCSVLQCVAACCSVLQCVAVCCSVLQCVAVCCSLL